MADTAPSARDRLLAVATRLFTEQGYEGTPVSRIVREAGVTMPVLYYHFGKKIDLLGAVITARGQWIRSDLKVDPARSFRENCRALVDHALDHMAEHRDSLRLRLQLQFESGPELEHLRNLMQEKRQRSVASLAELFASALPGSSPRRSAWLGDVYISGVQGLALEPVRAKGGNALLAAKADLLVHTLVTVSAMPEDELPNLAA